MRLFGRIKAAAKNSNLKRLGIESGIRSGPAQDIGTPRIPQLFSLKKSKPYNDNGAGYGTAVINDPALMQPWPLMVAGVANPASYGTRFSPKVPLSTVAKGGKRRVKGGVGITWPGGVQATAPQSEALGYASPMPIAAPPFGTLHANVISPLFGRPGFAYATWKPQGRIGPTLKGAPGTGQTGVSADRSRGFVPAAFASVQHMPMQQFDYSPPNDSVYDVGTVPKPYAVQPRTIRFGTNGRDLVGTYEPHDFTPADRFFKQGRSAFSWQDYSFGPEYRWLQPQQQVARYNLYNQVGLSRPLSPNNYFLGYQMQPAIAQQIGGVVGQGRPLGYGAS